MNDRFLKLANSAPTEEQRNVFLQQHFRLSVRSALDSCRGCEYWTGHHTGFQGKTPAFCSFVTQLPLNDGLPELERQLGTIGYRLEDVCRISLAGCSPANPVEQYGYRYQAASLCKSNFQWQLGLASSRVFVLLGLEACTYLFGDQPKNLQDVRGNWTELITPNGTKQFWFVTDHPGHVKNNPVMRDLMREDFEKLGSLLHYAWAVQMAELHPGSRFEHQLTYEQICDVVANDIRAALARIPPGKRSDEFMRLMLRIVRDPTGLAARALWDDEMARKCGVDLTVWPSREN